MTLVDKMAYRQIIGSLMKNPNFLLEYLDIVPNDFINFKLGKICFMAIKNLFQEGAFILSPIEIEQEIEKYAGSSVIYHQENGLDFLKVSYEFSEPNNFEVYYNRLKKCSLLYRLQKEKYDISNYYKDDIDIKDAYEEVELQRHFDEATIEDILNNVEGKYNIIRNEYLNGGQRRGDPSVGIFELIDELQRTPNIGLNLEGDIFSSICRGARQGCFYLKSASAGSGKTRGSVFDACRIAFPMRWSIDHNTFIQETDLNGNLRAPQKVLFIVTEMDKEEIQTIMLAYLSGVNEHHILTGKYDIGELTRVRFAAKIIQHYHDYFIVEEISDPNLVNVQSTIKKYATIDGIKYCFFDYIHSTPSMLEQFARNGINEASVLMLMANQIKQLAKDYNIFIFSATQVNMTAMDDDGEFKNEMSIRSSKAVADKCDIGYVMTKVREKNWNSIIPTLRKAAREGMIDAEYIENKLLQPTHVLDVYKMRRGRFKNVRVWTRLDLGTGERKDLFMTTAENEPITIPIDIFKSAKEVIFDWRNYEF